MSTSTSDNSCLLSLLSSFMPWCVICGHQLRFKSWGIYEEVGLLEMTTLFYYCFEWGFELLQTRKRYTKAEKSSKIQDTYGPHYIYLPFGLCLASRHNWFILTCLNGLSIPCPVDHMWNALFLVSDFPLRLYVNIHKWIVYWIFHGMMNSPTCRPKHIIVAFRPVFLRLLVAAWSVLSEHCHSWKLSNSTENKTGCSRAEWI